jgi:hypothetical protein
MMLGEIHTGEVVANDDRSRLHRIRVKLTGLYDGELPYWIRPGIQDIGKVWVPRIGDLVDVAFDESDQEEDLISGERFFTAPNYRYYPYGYRRGKKNKDGQQGVHDRWKTNYPERRGFESRAGHYVLFDDSKKESDQVVILSHRNGHRIEFRADGSVHLQSWNSDTLASSTVHLKDTSIDIKTSGTATVEAAVVSLAAGQVLVGAGAGGGAGSSIARGGPVAEFLDDIRTWLMTLQSVPGVSGGPLLSGGSPINVDPGAGAPPAVPGDIESESRVK